MVLIPASGQAPGRIAQDALASFCRIQRWRFPVRACTRPQPAHQIGRALQVRVNQNSSIHHSLVFPGFADLRRDKWMRCGRCSVFFLKLKPDGVMTRIGHIVPKPVR